MATNIMHRFTRTKQKLIRYDVIKYGLKHYPFGQSKTKMFCLKQCFVEVIKM